MAGTRWIPEATQIGRVSGGTMDTPNLPSRVVWHTIESPTGAPMFRSMSDYLLTQSVWPQVLYDPETDSLGQFCALDQSGRALRNSGSTRTNRTGRVCIQIEVLGRAAQPFTEQPTWRPGPNFRALMAAIRSWGIPDVWPAGRPQAYPGDHDDRDLATWLNHAGHFGHSQVPGNDHGDPGAINPARLWAAAAGAAPIEEEDMALTDADVQRIARAVWNATEPNPATADPNDRVRMGAVQAWRDQVEVFTRQEIKAALAPLNTKLDALNAKAAPVPTPVQVDAAAVAAALVADGGFADRLADAVARNVAKRLEA